MAAERVTFAKFTDGSLDKKISTNRLRTRSLLVARAAVAGWGKYIESVGGWRDHNLGGVNDHAEGRAVDIMKKGGCDDIDQYAEEFKDMCNFFAKYVDEYRIHYMIFRDKTWGYSEGYKPFSQWGDYRSGSDCNTKHMNHLHVTVYGGNDYPPGMSEWKTPSRLARPAPPRVIERGDREKAGIDLLGKDGQGAQPTTESTPTGNELIVSTLPTGKMHMTILTDWLPSGGEGTDGDDESPITSIIPPENLPEDWNIWGLTPLNPDGTFDPDNLSSNIDEGVD